MKITSILCTGTYYSPWFPYAIASIYKKSDKIIVVNAGHYLYNFNRGVWNIPLTRASDEIKFLDVNGKVLEIKNALFDNSFTNLPRKYPVLTQVEMRTAKDIYNYDVRGIVMSIATRAAFLSNADWVHKIDHDQVMYNDWNKYNGGSYMSYQYEFGNRVEDLTFVDMSEPFNDGTFTYKPYEEDWYQGSGSPALKSGGENERLKQEKFHSAHLRYCKPLICNDEEWRQHLYEFLLWRDYNNYVGVFNENLKKRVNDSIDKTLKEYAVVYPKSAIRLPDIAYLDSLEDIRKTLT